MLFKHSLSVFPFYTYLKNLWAYVKYLTCQCPHTIERKKWLAHAYLHTRKNGYALSNLVKPDTVMILHKYRLPLDLLSPCVLIYCDLLRIVGFQIFYR